MRPTDKMDFILAPLKQLKPASLAQLARLHCAVMHGLLSELGPGLVLRYYEIAQQYPGALGVCAIGTSGKLIGWAAGSSAPAALNGQLRQPLGWFLGQMLHLAVSNPRILLQLALSVLSTAQASQLSLGHIELTYIGVDPSAQGQGLGQALISAFTSQARTAGYSAIELSVETNNARAFKLYCSSSFEVVSTIREGRFERHRMRRNLSD